MRSLHALSITSVTYVVVHIVLTFKQTMRKKCHSKNIFITPGAKSNQTRQKFGCGLEKAPRFYDSLL